MLSKFSVKKSYTVLVAVVLVLVFGVVSFTRMTTDLLPNISLPYAIVMTAYPGASPETVEMVVTKPVEASMATVSNIESISSVSSENYSMVILEFSQSADMNAVSLEMRENLDQIKGYWDDSVSNPIIIKLNPDMLPVMIAAVGGNNMDAASVTKMTEDMLIPLICIGPDFRPGAELPKANICDIAPTIAALEGVASDRDWEGRSLL